MWYCHQLDRRIADHSLEHLFIECKKHFWLLLLSCLWVLAAAWGMNRPFHVRPQTSNLNDFFLAGHRSPDNSQRQRTKWERHRVLHCHIVDSLRTIFSFISTMQLNPINTFSGQCSALVLPHFWQIANIQIGVKIHQRGLLFLSASGAI